MSRQDDIMMVRTARDLGAAVRDARLGRGWTQAELAGRIGTSRQWLISFERGKSAAQVGTVLKALAVLGVVADIVPAPSAGGLVDLDELLDGT